MPDDLSVLHGEHRAALPGLALRILGTPLVVTDAKLDVVLHVLGPRIGIGVYPAATAAAERDRRPRMAETDAERPMGVAVIPIMGTIVQRAGGIDAMSGLSGIQALREQFRMALADPAVDGILLHVDSDGGEVPGVADMAAEIYAARGQKPIVAFADEAAYSAAYWLASAADTLLVAQTGGVGSVGAIGVHVDQSRRNDAAGLTVTVLRAGDLKANTNSLEPLSADGRGRLQDALDRITQTFARDVATYRGLRTDDVLGFKAATFHATDAIANGLADGLATYDTALATVRDAITERRRHAGARSAAMAAATDQPQPVATDKVVSIEDGHRIREEARAEGRAEAIREERARVQAINELCAIARKPALAASFIDAGASLDEVRKALLDATAGAGPEIDGTRATAAEPATARTIDVKGIYAARNAAIDEAKAARQRPVRIGIG